MKSVSQISPKSHHEDHHIWPVALPLRNTIADDFTRLAVSKQGLAAAGDEDSS
jgi:hypothetical protein